MSSLNKNMRRLTYFVELISGKKKNKLSDIIQQIHTKVKAKTVKEICTNPQKHTHKYFHYLQKLWF